MHTHLTRRHLLRLGALGILGANTLHAEGKKRKARAHSVIFLHQWGGPGHHETFDMKPLAAEAIRGEFKPISSRVPGMPVCERLPAMAAVMDRVTLLHGLQQRMISVCATRATSSPPMAASSMASLPPSLASHRSWPIPT
jgi:hypothetical protein